MRVLRTANPVRVTRSATLLCPSWSPHYLWLLFRARIQSHESFEALHRFIFGVEPIIMAVRAINSGSLMAKKLYETISRVLPRIGRDENWDNGMDQKLTKQQNHYEHRRESKNADLQSLQEVEHNKKEDFADSNGRRQNQQETADDARREGHV